MKNATILLWKLCRLLCVPALLYASLTAQVPGDKGVYPQSGSTIARSRLYIDATVMAGSDFCAKLGTALSDIKNSTNYPGGAAVIDARGVPATSTSLTCAQNPWNSITSPKPAVILLPAATIKIASTWTLPAETKLVGMGGEDPGEGFTVETILQAQSGLSGPMIAMGSGSGCQGVSVEDLVLDGNAQGNDGIDNEYCQDLSYVNHVTLYRVTGYGIYVYGSAENSGPYSNITCDTAGNLPTACAEIKVPTMGVHGMICTTGSTTPSATAAIYLDSSNNVIEDVRVEGFYEGIIVGANATASSNVLRNILGDTNKATGAEPPPVSVIEIAGTNVSDLAIMGVGNTSIAPNAGHTITDNLTLSLSPYINDSYVAMYVVGKKSSNGYSRYTTSQSLANWSVGTGAPSGTCSPGSLYSNINNNASPALYICSAVSAYYKQWEPIPNE